MAAVEVSGTAGPELDIPKLHSLPSEQQDLYLLTFVSDLAKHASSLDADGASAQQLYIKKELFKVLSLSSPASSRVVRNNLGLCFASVFGRGDRKLLFETVNELLHLANTGKSEKDSRASHAAVYCLGAVFEAAGDSAISLSSMVLASLQRLIKASQNNVGFRAAIFKAIGRVVKGVGRSADETITRDVWKQCRVAAAGDKGVVVQASACGTLEQLFLFTPYFNNSNDFEKLQSVLWKALDTSSSLVRRAAATCLSAALLKCYSATPEQTIAPSKKSKKKKKGARGEDLDEELERSSSPAPSKTPATLSLSLPDILSLLSAQYCRAATSNKTRAGIIMTYVRLCKGLDESLIEAQYSTIFRHFCSDLLSSPTIVNNRYKLLLSRKYVQLVLSTVIGQKLLGEGGQTSAIKFLVNSVLKDYPQSDVKERPEPTKESLVAALCALNILIKSLGSACSSVGELCRVGVFQVLEHSSYTVQAHAADCLKALVVACPQLLLPAISIAMNSVNREVGLLTTPRRSPRRCLGLALGLSAAVSTAALQPLYGSVDVYSRILSQATSILKSSSSSDVRISSTQIQVAWTLIGGLMSLGPNFVKIHLSQLLLLWKNALPKPLSKDNIGQRGLLELSFLAHVRECALGSISAFLTFNSRLLTVDVSKRLAAMLQNTSMFLGSLPAKKTTDEGDKRLSPALQLLDYDSLVRRRVFQCYMQLVNLSPQGNQEALLQSSIVAMAASSFADPVTGSAGSLSSTIAISSGNFDSIWELGDNAGLGLTSLVEEFDIAHASERYGDRRQHWSVQHGLDAVVDHALRSPTCSSLEHDASQLYTSLESTSTAPLGTGVIDASIRLFAMLLPFQPPKIQESILEQVSTLYSSAGRQGAARQTAIMINISTAIFFSLQPINREGFLGSGSLRATETERAIQELLHGFLRHSDASLRFLAAEGIGRLCKSSGNELTSKEVHILTEMIVSDRDPNTRAGCATALGCIHSELGGMAAGFHLRNITSILSSLSTDPHPTVHFWALDGLAKIAESAGLTFSSSIAPTLGMLAQLYVMDSHNEDAATLAASNMEADLPTPAVIARCVNSMINCLGPDLQDSTKARNMILTLTYQFQAEQSPLVTCESLRCLENFSMYAPGFISFIPYIKELQSRLLSDEPDVQTAAFEGLYHAMRKDAEEVLRSADLGLEDDLWLLLNETHGKVILGRIISDWVHQSGPSDIDIWIPRIQKVLTRVRRHKDEKTLNTAAATELDLQDEEVAGFAASASQTTKDEPSDAGQASQELLRWQTRHTALACLLEILAAVAKRSVHDSSALSKLQPRLADIVRIAFSASTAPVIELRISGVQIIEKVLQLFGRIPDPDFPEAPLLEQYQAQISSALTPAFSAESSPVLAAEAVNVCATFISTGIVTDVDRMGRILKLLISALDEFSKDAESAAIGDLKGLSSNAQVMVKLAIFSTWAELQIASHEQKYLEDVVRPHLTKLTPLWLSSLREYARLKFEPDVSTTGAATLTGGLDTIYAALNRETLLKFYQASWLNFVDAIASLIDEDSEFVFDALDGKADLGTSKGSQNGSQDINYRDEPVAFFFVLFGITFEALVGRSTSDTAMTSERTLGVLRAMQKIVRPSVAGLAIYQDAIFSESMDLFDRLILTEGIEIQTVVVEIAHNLCIGHPSARRSQDYESGDHLSDDIDQLFELTRIIVLVISRHIPSLSQNSGLRTTLSPDVITLVLSSLTALVDAAQVFPAIIKSDLHACILQMFTTLVSTPACQETLVPEALPIFRRFVTTLVRNPQPEVPIQLRTTLSRLLMVIKHTQKRASETDVPCEKNALLASTILLTSAAKIMPVHDPTIIDFVSELSDCLDSHMTTKVAAGLSRSLLLLFTATVNSPSLPSTTEAEIAAQLLPRLNSFLAQPSTIESTDEARIVVAQALTSFAIALPSDKRSLAFSLVVPTLLQRAKLEGEGVWRETSTRLMELAGREPTAFKAIVGAMDGAQKSFIEEVIRKGAAAGGGAREGLARQDTGRDEDKEPTIALKMNF